MYRKITFYLFDMKIIFHNVFSMSHVNRNYGIYIELYVTLLITILINYLLYKNARSLLKNSERKDGGSLFRSNLSNESTGEKKINDAT